MFRWRHWCGYALLSTIAIGLACGWWQDRYQGSQRAAVLDDGINYLVKMLNDREVVIERIEGGGFRRWEFSESLSQGQKPDRR